MSDHPQDHWDRHQPEGPDPLSGYVKGFVRLTVGPTAPTDPEVNDLWIDTSGL